MRLTGWELSHTPFFPHSGDIEVVPMSITTLVLLQYKTKKKKYSQD